jgi:hypothetical protein
MGPSIARSIIASAEDRYSDERRQQAWALLCFRGIVEHMKAQVVLLLFVAAIVFVIWFTWTNRASEKIITSTVPIAIAAIVGILLAGLVFGGEEDFEAVFPVCFMIDRKTKLEISPFAFNPFRSRSVLATSNAVAELKEERPELFPVNLNNFSRNIYQHWLQRAFVDFLSTLYQGTWKARAIRFDIGSIGFGQYGPAPDSTEKSKVLETKDIEEALGQNLFARSHMWPLRNWLCRPVRR